jgi:hypothetical protein
MVFDGITGERRLELLWQGFVLGSAAMYGQKPKGEQVLRLEANIATALRAISNPLQGGIDKRALKKEGAPYEVTFTGAELEHLGKCILSTPWTAGVADEVMQVFDVLRNEALVDVARKLTVPHNATVAPTGPTPVPRKGRK